MILSDTLPLSKSEKQGKTDLRNGLFSKIGVTCVRANLKIVQYREEMHKRT